MNGVDFSHKFVVYHLTVVLLWNMSHEPYPKLTCNCHCSKDNLKDNIVLGIVTLNVQGLAE